MSGKSVPNLICILISIFGKINDQKKAIMSGLTFHKDVFA